MLNLFLSAGMLTGFPLFAKAYGWSGTEMAHAVSSTSDGGFAVIGRTSSYGAGNDDFLFIKVSSDGVLEWTRTYGGAGYDYGMQVYQTQDMGYVMFGYTSSYSSYYTLLLKTASNGALQWAKAYNIYPAWWISWEGWLDLTSDGGFIFHSGNGDIRVVKTASDGTIMWAKRIDGPNEDFPGHITETSDGGFVVVGQTASWGSGPSDFIVVKLASDGAVQWARVYGGPNDDQARYVAEAADGNLVVVGISRILDPTRDDILVLKLSASDGNPIWERAFGASSGSGVYGVVSTADNCIAILTSHPSILKMDLDGNLIWSKRIQIASPWDFHDIINSLNGDLVCAGTYSPSFLLLRLGLDGNYSGCVGDWNINQINGAISNATITVGADVSIPAMDVVPSVSSVNPTTTDLCAPMENSETEEGAHNQVRCLSVSGGLVFISQIAAQLDLYSPDGRLVYSGQLREGLNRITIGRGVYLWRAGGCAGKAIVR